MKQQGEKKGSGRMVAGYGWRRIVSVSGLVALLVFGCSVPPSGPPPARPPLPSARIPPPAPVPRPVPETGAAASLYTAARNSLAQGSYTQAELSLERALRIEPRNPYYWFTMAEIKYRQQQYAQAVNLCLKTKSLAGQGTQLARQNDELLEEARRRLAQ